ncbi:MAG: vitamin K epoxide reductase family protein [Balneolaceae bacterium]|nr:vitamin K epoxide reductase family protein [Balneolaceae bacterium]
MEHIVWKYLKHLGITVSKKYFEKCVLSHPDYPSLLSIADTLERLGINHEIGRIEAEHLKDVTFPYMLQLDRHGAELVFIKDQQDLDDHNVLEHWKGVVIKLEPTDAITDKEHNKQLVREKRDRKLSVALLIALVGLILIPLLQDGGLGLTALLLLTSLGGVTIGYLLLAKDLGITYKPVESFCNAGKRTNCDRILNAEEATLFGVFTFSDAATSYFGWQLIMVGLFIPLFADAASFLAILAGASMLTIPVIGYSLYYQQFVTNTWCRLCVIIDATLGAQIIIFTVMHAKGLFRSADISFVPTAIALLLFVALASSIILLKERLKTANASTRAETVAKRVKYDPEVFTHLLLQQEYLDIKPFEPEITIGNPAAPVQILMVANLHCNPCRIAFEAMTQLTVAYPKKVEFAIRFTPGMNKAIADLSASSYLIRYWQQHIDGQPNELTHTKTFIGDWYAQMNPETFVQMYPANGALDIKNNGVDLLKTATTGGYKKMKLKAPLFLLMGIKCLEVTE